MVTSLALIIGLITANVVKPGAGVNFSRTATTQVAEITAQANSMNWGKFFSHIVPVNIVDAFAKGDILQVLFFSILFGIGLKWMGDSGRSLFISFEKINKALFNVLKIIMKVSPLGALAAWPIP